MASNPYTSGQVAFGGQGAPEDMAFQILRAQQLAKALQSEADQPVESESKNAPISWTQGLAKMFDAYQGKRQLDKAQQLIDRRNQQLRSGNQAMINSIAPQAPTTLDSIPGGPANSDAPPLLRNPNTPDLPDSPQQQLATQLMQPNAVPGGPMVPAYSPQGQKLAYALMGPGQDPQQARNLLQAELLKQAMPPTPTFESAAPGASIYNKATGQIASTLPPKLPAEDRELIKIDAPGTKLGYETIERRNFKPGMNLWEKPAAPNQFSFVASDKDDDATAQAIADGDMPLRSGNRLTPNDLKLNRLAKEKNPELQGSDFYLKKAGAIAFGPGKLGSQIRSFNVAEQHLDTLEQLGEALDSGDNQLFNTIAAKWGSMTGNPAPTSYQAAVDIIGKEITKSIVNAGGSAGEREEAAKNIGLALAPEQRGKAISAVRSLMNGQLTGLAQQYKDSRQTRPFENLLTDTARKYYQASVAPKDVSPDDAALLKKWGG
jgi:hypothetical protein